MKNQRKTLSILKVTFIFIYLIIILKPSFLSAQNTEQQKVEQAEQSNEELTQALFAAVTNGRVDEVKKLIAQGADVNVVDEYGRTPLHITAAAGQVEIVKLLLAHGARLEIKDNAGRTPLHYAAGAAAPFHPQPWPLDAARILLDKGAGINVQDKRGWTPLHYAVFELYSIPTVEFLIERGADINCADNRGFTPYSFLTDRIAYYGLKLDVAGVAEYVGEFKKMAEFLQDNYDVKDTGNKEHSRQETANLPITRIEAAIENAHPGDIIVVRGGVYACPRTIHIDNSGEPGKLIQLIAFPGEVPVFDFSGTPGDPFFITGSYWHIKGLTITQGDRGVVVYGAQAHHNVLEQITVHDNELLGMHVMEGAHHNIVLNCDSYRNFDRLRNGQDSDGIALSNHVGQGNIVIGSRAWNNSDDGFDLGLVKNPVRCEQCYSWRNGENIWQHPFFTGNANGFKLGREEGRHILIHCLAWNNPYVGFKINNNQVGVILCGCTAIGNLINYHFPSNVPGSQRSIFRNNISVTTRKDVIDERADSRFNSWDSELGVVITDNDFLSLDDSMLTAPRNPDGSIPENNFLRLVPTSAAIDKGVDIGMPFVGQRPDLGAFEYDPNGVSGSYIKMLHQYVRDRNIEKIKELLSQGEDINSKDWLGYTPLQWAVYFGYPEVVELLLIQGANPDIQSTTGRYALEIARAMAYGDIESLLRQHGARTDLSTVSEQEISAQGQIPVPQETIQDEEHTNELTNALLTAVADGRVDEAKKLIAQGVDVAGESGANFFIIAVLQEDVDMVKLLVEHGVRFDTKIPTLGLTTMEYAACQGRGEAVKVFLSHGVDTSSLPMAACAGDLTIVRSLIAQGADINTRDEAGLTPLLWAAVTDQVDVVEYLLANGAGMATQTPLGPITLLYLAVQNDSARIVKLAISHGADVNAVSRRGEAPLLGAKSREVAELLIDGNAEVNATNRTGQTPLHMACSRGNKDVVALLLARGADVDAKDRRGQTPLDLARAQGHGEIVKLLTEYKSETSGQETGTKEQQTTEIKP